MGNSQKHNAQFLEHNSLMPSEYTIVSIVVLYVQGIQVKCVCVEGGGGPSCPPPPPPPPLDPPMFPILVTFS